MKYRDHEVFLWTVVMPWKDEYSFPADADEGFHFNNTLFGSVDAEVLYAVIRHADPARVIEIGAGWSTLITRSALAMNSPASVGQLPITSIDPDPPAWLSGVQRERAGVQPDDFWRLASGDVLFVDGSHVGNPGGDVDFVLTKVLPVLPKGVFVHFHDIFIPDPYPDSWSDRGYDEQDRLVQFIEANPKWEVMFSSHWAQKVCPEVLAEAFDSYDETKWPGSFWMVRV